jgi:hypothetical protein
MTTPVGRRYVDAVNGADLDALMALFADGAVLHHPMGTFADAEAMRAFYRDVVVAGKAVTTIVASSRDGDREWVEIEATSASGSGKVVHAVDVFEVDESGRIARLAIYYR